MPSISHLSTPFVNLTTSNVNLTNSNVNLTIQYVNDTNSSANYLGNMTEYIFLEVESEKSPTQLAFVILMGSVVLIAIIILSIVIIKENKRVQDWVNWVRDKKYGG
tara:strand:- start:260 stop:577 length:318 start_codon:yes stop_codon:yes gene_type:complete